MAFQDIESNSGSTIITVNIEDVDNRPPWFQPCTESLIGVSTVCISSGYTGTVNLTQQAVGFTLKKTNWNWNLKWMKWNVQTKAREWKWNFTLSQRWCHRSKANTLYGIQHCFCTIDRSFVLDARSGQSHRWWQRDKRTYWLQIPWRWDLCFDVMILIGLYGGHIRACSSMFIRDWTWLFAVCFRKWNFWYQPWQWRHHNEETRRCCRSDRSYGHGEKNTLVSCDLSVRHSLTPW